MDGPPSTVCIVIPCFDAQETLAATLESTVSQEHVSEIVVVDDGSRDGSFAIAERFAPRVRTLTGPNRGVSAARNRGIDETSAEWILFLDADDLLMPGTIAARLDSAASADVVVCDWEDLGTDDAGLPAVGSRRSIDWVALRRDAELATATGAWATTAAILYRRSLVEAIGGFRQDLPVIQDARFLFDAAAAGARFSPSNHVGAHYRIVPNSLSRRNPARFWRDVLLNGQQIEALWRARGTLNDEREAALAGIYDNAARGLLGAGDKRFFEAVAEARRVAAGGSLFAAIAGPMARVFGISLTRATLSALGRV
ncbi:glycosyltransferase family 2 protein [Alsobacter sp. R-9]